MAAQLATAATHGGAISRAISGGKFFIGGRSNSSSGASHVTLDKLSATKVLQVSLAGKIPVPIQPVLIDATDEERSALTQRCATQRPKNGAHNQTKVLPG